MQRRLFGKLGVLGTGVALAGCIKKKQETQLKSKGMPKVKWKMVTSWPRSLDVIMGGAEQVAELVKEFTDGAFEISVHAGGEIVPGLGVFDAVQNGSVECGHSIGYYYVGKNPALAFGSSMPFGLTTPQQNAWLFHAGGLEKMRKIYADFGMISFPCGNTGCQMGGWFRKEIQVSSDLGGLKMRIPGWGGKVMGQLGVNVVNVPAAEIYQSLERGAIDATEWNAPYDDEKLGLQNVAKFYYYPGWWEPGTVFDLMVNKAAFEKLPKSYQTAFRLATESVNMNMYPSYHVKNQEALERLKNSGTQLVQFSQDILEKSHEATVQLYEEEAGKDKSFKEVYEGWKKFHAQVNSWYSVNELPYLAFNQSRGLK